MLHLQRTPDVGRHRRKECGALAAADFQPFLPHLHKVVLHALDVAQVDEVALVAAGKMIGRKPLFRFQQTAPHRPDFVGGMVVQQAVAGLQVENVVGVQLACAPPGVCSVIWPPCRRWMRCSARASFVLNW